MKHENAEALRNAKISEAMVCERQMCSLFTMMDPAHYVTEKSNSIKPKRREKCQMA